MTLKPSGQPASASSFFAPSGSYASTFRFFVAPNRKSGTICPAGTASPSITRSTIAPRLIIFDSALRTRASLSGFRSSGLPSFAVTVGVTLRSLSMCTYIRRSDTLR